MKILIKVIYIIILFILFSCEEDERRISLNETFVLQYGETRTLDEQDQFSVSFIELAEDSRCPANAICVWAGQARVQIEVNDDLDVMEVELVNGSVLNNQTSIIKTGHYTVELLKVIPFPIKNSDQTVKSEYSIQLIISSN